MRIIRITLLLIVYVCRLYKHGRIKRIVTLRCWLIRHRQDAVYLGRRHHRNLTALRTKQVSTLVVLPSSDAAHIIILLIL